MFETKYNCFSGTEDDNVPSADSLNDLDQIEEVDEGLDEAPDNNDDDDENDDNVSDYEPQSGVIMSRHSDPKSIIPF